MWETNIIYCLLQKLKTNWQMFLHSLRIYLNSCTWFGMKEQLNYTWLTFTDKKTTPPTLIIALKLKGKLKNKLYSMWNEFKRKKTLVIFFYNFEEKYCYFKQQQQYIFYKIYFRISIFCNMSIKFSFYFSKVLHERRTWY